MSQSSPQARLTSEVNRLIQGPQISRIEPNTGCRFEIEGEQGPEDERCVSALRRYREVAQRYAELAAREGERARESLSRLDIELSEAERRVEEECKAKLREITILGIYSCQNREIVLYLGCYRLVARCPSLYDATWTFLETLAHELIHHMQFTGAKIKVGNKEYTAAVRYNGCNDQNVKLAMSFPYRYRPHEAEAFARMRGLAQALYGTDVEAGLRELLRNYRGALGI
jgi:hypothetical protein